MVLFVHCALLIIWAMSIEQRVVVDANEAANISTILDALLQVFVLILTTALIGLMAPLAIRAQFLKSQTLTALSDVSSSWNGLGISALTLYHNIHLPAAVFPVILSTIYFLALTGLHVTTPLILTVPVVGITRTETASTVTGTLDVRTLFPSSYPLPSNFSNITFDWYLSSASLSLLGQGGASDSGHIGLQGNRVFDTLVSPLSASNASAVVNYTDFNVKCGKLPQDPVIDTNRVGDVGTNISIALGDGGSLGKLLDTFPTVYTSRMIDDDAVATKALAPSDILVRIPSYVPGDKGITGGRNIFVYSLYNAGGRGSSPIADSSGSVGPSVTAIVYGVLLPYLPVDDGSDGYSSGPVNIQVIGCSLSTKSGNMTIDATTNRMSDISQISQPRVRMWEDWEPDNTSSNSLADLWGSMFAPSSSMALWRDTTDPDLSRGMEWRCIGGIDPNNYTEIKAAQQSCHVPTVVEKYLSDSLFGIPQRSDGWMWLNDTRPHTNFENATLATLEESLAKATAMMMSVVAREGTLTTYTVDVIELTQNEFRPQSQTGLTTVQETVLKGRLTININVLALGTGASIILLLIAIDILAPQIRAVESVQARTPLNGVSLLQIASLDTTSVTERLAGIDPNATEVRRRAGLFNVTVVDGKLVPVGNSEDAREKEIETGGRNEDDRNALLDLH
ncbi:hypothetical protein OF83DRAFT_760817 [Amylostereum chailletii]|nr:hypothetical protein OF83DRAFT_760817 [Amylostereum chailletii]